MRCVGPRTGGGFTVASGAVTGDQEQAIKVWDATPGSEWSKKDGVRY